MKKKTFKFLIFIITFCTADLFSQNSIGINNETPNGKSALDVVGAPLPNPQGILVPRYSGNIDADFGTLTNAERGLVYYDLSAEEFRFYAGSGNWKSFGGTGSSISVGLVLPAEFSIAGSPVTGVGTITGTWAAQSPNLVFASPNGIGGTPSFRTLIEADLPNISADKITTGILPFARGGTGASLSGVAGGILYSTATGTAISTAGTNGQVLRSNGTAAPTWTNVPLGSGSTDLLARWLDENTLTTSIIEDNGGSLGVLVAPDGSLATLLVRGGKDNAGVMGVGISGNTYSFGVKGYSENEPGGSAIGVYGSAGGKADSVIGVKAISNSIGPLGIGLLAESNSGALVNYGVYAAVNAGDERYSGVFMGGNFGIGTNKPKHDLHVYAGGVPNFVLQNREVISSPGETIASIGMGDNVFYNQAEILAVRNLLLSNATDLVFMTTKSGNNFPEERIRIGHSGNVGIGGVVDPQSNLHVAGGFRLQNATAQAGRVLTATNAFGDATWADISGGISGTGNAGKMAFWDGSNSLAFNNEFSWDITNQRLGIGTAFPNTRLEIMGSSSSTVANAPFEPREVTLSIHNSDNSTPNNISSINFNTNRSPDNAIYSSAKIVGIHKNHLPSLAEGELAFFTREPANLMERMRISSNGNVGIGVTAPVQRLQVDGNISIPNTSTYRYNSAKTLVKSIGTTEFRNILNGNPLFLNSFIIGENNSGTTASFYAQIQLPNGAQLVNVTFHVEDNAAGLDIQSGFAISNLVTGAITPNPGATSTGAPGYTTLGVTPSPTIINNSTSVYYAYVIMPSTSLLRLRGAVVTYSVLEAD